MKKGLGELERALFAYVGMTQQPVVRTGDLVDALQLTPRSERNLLSRLAQAGWIARVKRGLYLVPQRLPLGGKWSPDEILALTTLMTDARARFQICGPNAFNRYGFDEQIPTRLYVYNDKLSGRTTIGRVELTLIKVAANRLGGTEQVRTREGLRAVYCSRVRTLLDAVYDWSRFNSLPRAYDWIRNDLAERNIKASELVAATLKYGDIGTIRRIGALLEQAGVATRLLRKLAKAAPATKSLIPWIPTLPKRGTVNRRWGVVINSAE
ncbi:type IV toxin-antitoxin system AbiEi family antitoxin domain-containing protein [Steroidobacter sp.]|uniref:type IV toxin-antitoxin system AbiEi family antitoxin domain-containing protein n=1 Tax=Steroidobacter sp. TaxID=1978227 RepID=UPI001A36E791|nr:type IV toxin-antitoxin system AbiEi family antitoxin domain-containing protein [Steroidobacter sp.]MBL8268075.1 type IV toxin-antitoxin system AbiEi family antitoxin domain-containing protein [Steroidobacter sp.]